MKMFLMIMATILMVSVYTFAVDTDSSISGSATSQGTNTSDHVTLNDGKVTSTKGGVTSPIASDTTMSNGTVVKPDGTYYLKGSDTVNTLKDGETLNVDGTISKEDKPNPALDH